MKSGVASQRRYAGTGGSLGTSWHTVHFGLGNATAIDGLRIRWPGGKTQVVSNVETNRVVKVVEQ